jgi:hypothetical protein
MPDAAQERERRDEAVMLARIAGHTLRQIADEHDLSIEGARPVSNTAANRYRLLFGPPLPGYDAHSERLINAATASMDLLVETMPIRNNGSRPTKVLAGQLREWAERRGIHVDAGDALRAVLTWSRIHGFVSLEIASNYASMGIDPDLLFETELRALPA